MNNIDYDSILSGFQRKRLENSRISDNRKAEIYEKIPEIRRIDQEIASSSIQAARDRIRKLPVNKESVNTKEPDGVHKHTPYENASNTLAKCRDYVEHFETSHPGILIYGETGLGKTFLSNCIAKALLDKGHTVLYLTSINLFENILSGIIMGNVREKDKLMLYDYIYNCELLIIDDLGTEVPNTFVNSQLFEIINMRNNKSLATLISTNLSMHALSERYTERIMSRIIGGFTVFQLYGDNIRYAKRKDLIQNRTSK